MVHRCICSQYSSKAPHHPKKRNKSRTERPQPPQLLTPGSQGLALGREVLTGRPALNGQLPGCGSRADLAINFQLSANKVLKTSVPLPRGEGRGHINAGSFVESIPNRSSVATGLSQAGVCYHSFFFSSMETPPGPRATTRSKPPITDMVWKKSYLRKSCMGL